mmetsp:Transcript_29155/g.93114  ORF Transcript_29155/g.93114 Transcript_29155/m.93114 type:complete len:105 (-) Transcript_29155:99-413(-)|eukprot:CAMPEP_0182905776 /NCGR_PEP_ID=MMETSP0034_2-20130328/33205_1 /TAXON_ID=156128 /ORGANISM="Nephroselmis pyriformis, Strain CCMP717" /LENGTH=104 /DNA_ID=CAMNT_0025041267 /DNA_START=749 /DNA_END=1063 /DNA_ORIENTATION=-
MDDRRYALLRRKLEALNYSESLDPSSAPLAEKLVDDLVHTTESYRALKIRCSKQTHELEAWNSKVGASPRPIVPLVVALALPSALSCIPGRSSVTTARSGQGLL